MSFPLPVMERCYFCEIVGDNVERWNVIAENDLTVTLLNGRQFEVGQCMVISRRHAPTLLELTAQEQAAVMAAAKRLTRVMVDAFATDGVLLYQNNGLGSGQEVPHFHLHVVPRRADSDWGFGPPHLARLAARTQPAKFNHAAVTEAKRATVEQLRQHFGSSGAERR